VTTIAVGTVKGGIGATTTALALSAALAESRPTLLVEADPSGGSLAGTCPGLAPEPTLESMMLERRTRASLDQLLACTQALGEVLVAPCPAEPFRAQLVVGQPRSPWLDTLRDVDGLVVCDVGRIQPSSVSWPLLRAANVVLLVTGATPMSVAATAEWAEQRGRVAPGAEGLTGDSTAIAVLAPPGAGRFGAPDAALARELGPRFVGHLPWDPASVDLLLRGASLRHRSLRRSGLGAAARALATSLVASVGVR
jgi:hypothetical protein